MDTKIMVTLAAVFLSFGYSQVSAQYEGAATAVNSLKTKDGTRYEDVLVVKTDSDGLMFRHSKGIAKIPFTELSANLQDLYGYQPEEPASEEISATGKPEEESASLAYTYLVLTHVSFRPQYRLRYPNYIATPCGRARTLSHFLDASGLRYRRY